MSRYQQDIHAHQTQQSPLRHAPQKLWGIPIEILGYLPRDLPDGHKRIVRGKRSMSSTRRYQHGSHPIQTHGTPLQCPPQKFRPSCAQPYISLNISAGLRDTRPPLKNQFGHSCRQLDSVHCHLRSCLFCVERPEAFRGSGVRVQRDGGGRYGICGRAFSLGFLCFYSARHCQVVWNWFCIVRT